MNKNKKIQSLIYTRKSSDRDLTQDIAFIFAKHQSQIMSESIKRGIAHKKLLQQNKKYEK